MNLLTLPAPISDEIPKELKLNEHKHTLIFGDVHSPRTNNKLIDAALRYAISKKIPRLILNGDALDMEFFSRFVNRTGHSPDNVDAEMEASEALFKVFLRVFDEVIYLPGNHDARSTSAMNKKISMDRFIRMCLGDAVLDNMITTERGYIKVDTPSGEWIITHQIGKGRSVPLSTVMQYSTTNNTNVIGSHEHFLGAVRNRNDSGWAIHSGHMCDETLMEYKQMSPGNYTQWAAGFVELTELGQPILWYAEDLYRYMETK